MVDTMYSKSSLIFNDKAASRTTKADLFSANISRYKQQGLKQYLSIRKSTMIIFANVFY